MFYCSFLSYLRLSVSCQISFFNSNFVHIQALQQEMHTVALISHFIYCMSCTCIQIWKVGMSRCILKYGCRCRVPRLLWGKTASSEIFLGSVYIEEASYWQKQMIYEPGLLRFASCYILVVLIIFTLMAVQDHVLGSFTRRPPEIVRVHSDGDSGNDSSFSVPDLPLPQAHQLCFTSPQLGLHLACGWMLYSCR